MASQERVALVTGGAGGIGGAIARQLSDTHHVVLLDRASEPPVDLADEDQTRSAARMVLRAFGRCDVIVHAAAAFDRGALGEIDRETWRHVHAVNVESAIWLAQELTPAMAERSFGRIVLIISNTVWHPPAPDMLAYITSKAAMVGLARSLAVGLGQQGITVNCVAPGLTPTEHALTYHPPEFFAREQGHQAIPRLLTSDDVAWAVSFLVSDGASAVTGQTICTDGGLVFP